MSSAISEAKNATPKDRINTEITTHQAINSLPSVNVSVVRNITTISTRDKTTGKVESKTFLGTPLLPSDFDRSK
jgi:hypothetical protein